jgi:hypothetical protein
MPPGEVGELSWAEVILGDGGTNTVTVIVMVVTAFGVAYVVEKMVFVMVEVTVLGEKTVMMVVVVIVTSRFSLTPLTPKAPRISDVASWSELPIALLAGLEVEVTVTVDVCVPWPGLTNVRTSVLVTTTTAVSGGPVKEVTVFVTVCVMVSGKSSMPIPGRVMGGVDAGILVLGWVESVNASIPIRPVLLLRAVSTFGSQDQGLENDLQPEGWLKARGLLADFAIARVLTFPPGPFNSLLA